MNELDKVYNEYHKLTNMSYSEFLNWSRNPCSYKASLDRRPIQRNLLLLSTPKSQWTQHHINEAKKMISFEKRHSKAPAGREVPGCGVSKRTIARKNWAVDPNK